MTSDDPSSTPTQDDGNWADQAEPYRTPGPIPDQAARRGALGPPLVWFLTAGVLIGAGAMAWAWQRADDNAVQYIEDFGGYRGPPPDLIPDGVYEEEMITEAP